MSAQISFEDMIGGAPTSKPCVVDASSLGAIRTIVLTESGAELTCASGTLVLSAEQYFEFVKYRKPAISVLP